MNTWELAILKTIDSLGGVADLQEIYQRIGRFRDLTAGNLASTRHGGRQAYEHGIRSYASELLRSGFLSRVSRGRYRLTPISKQMLEA